jgi:hypothetical protein
MNSLNGLVILPKQDHFRSPPPPEINSDAYTIAFNEVKEVGCFDSETGTKDQSHMAMWWKDFVENSHNRLARHLVEVEHLNLWDAARTFALMNMTIYDAYVNVFDNKFFITIGGHILQLDGLTMMAIQPLNLMQNGQPA